MRNELYDNQYWVTQQGEYLPIADMGTRHLFNTIKILYNHLADQYQLPIVGYYSHYLDFEEMALHEPQKMVSAIGTLLMELSRRGNADVRTIAMANQISDRLHNAETRKTIDK